MAPFRSSARTPGSEAARAASGAPEARSRTSSAATDRQPWADRILVPPRQSTSRARPSRATSKLLPRVPDRDAIFGVRRAVSVECAPVPADAQKAGAGASKRAVDHWRAEGLVLDAERP